MAESLDHLKSTKHSSDSSPDLGRLSIADVKPIDLNFYLAALSQHHSELKASINAICSMRINQI